MVLNWNEIKSRALLFSKTWADASNEDSQAKPFLLDFFEIFGITNKRVATFELHVKKLGGAQGFVDLFWPGFAGEPLSDKHRTAIEQAVQCVLDARAQFSGSSLADLYDPLTIPPALFKAHQKLDTAVDVAYQPSGGKKPTPPTPNASPSSSTSTNVSPACYLRQLKKHEKQDRHKVDRYLSCGVCNKETLRPGIHPVHHHTFLGSYYCARN